MICPAETRSRSRCTHPGAALLSSFWSKDRIVAPPGFNRWQIPPASIAIHLCIGSVYAQMTSIANMLGRIGWASASDSLGRKRTYTLFF
ncbi:MAG: hypothetical protein EHM42_09005, partial [Planctomycetaceae bacterium]